MDGKKRIAATIKDYLARERVSREEFAFRTKLGKSTVDKLLIGLFSDRTLSIVESHTKLALRSTLAGDLAPAAARDEARLSRPGRAFDRRAALHEHERRSGARFHCGRAHARTSSRRSRACAGSSSSRAIRASSTRARPRTCAQVAQRPRRSLHPRRQRPDRRRPHPRQRAAHRRRIRQAHLGREIRPGASATSSPCRTTSPSASSPPSSRTSTRRKGSAPPAKQPGSLDAWGLAVRAMGMINRMERNRTTRHRNSCAAPSRWSRAMRAPMPC